MPMRSFMKVAASFVACVLGGAVIAATPETASAAPPTIAVGSGPRSAAISADESFAMVANGGNNTVSRVRLSDNTVVATISVGAAPWGTAINSTGTYAYVANTSGNSVSRINLSSNTVDATITVGTSPRDIRISPDGSYLYVTNSGVSTVSRIRTSDNAVTATITVGNNPSGVDFAPDGTYAYVANSGSSVVSRIRTSDDTVVATVDLGTGNNATSVAISPTGDYAYVAQTGANKVSRIRTSDNTVTSSVVLPAGSGPLTLDYLADGSSVFVGNRDANTVSRIDTASDTLAATFAVGSFPRAVYAAPTSNFVLVPNSSSNNVSRISPPSAPTITSVTPGDEMGSVAFTAANANGLTLSNYEYSIDNGTTWTAVSPASTSSPIKVPGLVNGTSYQVKLRAISEAGRGTASTASAVTPAVPSNSVAAGTTPYLLAISADSATALVSNREAGTVTRIRTADNTVVATINVGALPVGVAIAPNGQFAYVANTDSNSVSRVDLTNNTVAATITGITRAHAVAISPDGSFAYVTSLGDNTVRRIRTSDNTVTATTAVQVLPVSVAISPDGSFAYVANIDSNSVQRIRTSDNTVTATIAVGANPRSVRFSGDGSFAVVANQSAGTVSRIRTSDNTVTATIGVGTTPYGLSVLGNSSILVANRGSNTLTRIDASSNSATTFALTDADMPTDVQWAPDSSFALVTQYGSGEVIRVAQAAAPTGLVAASSPGAISVSFTAGSDIGVALTNYEYSTNNGSTWAPRSPAGTSSPIVITGLAAGTGYQVQLRAVNGLGSGRASSAVAATTPTIPVAPTGVSVTNADGGASVAFTAPASDGGSPITNYQYSLDNGATWQARSPVSTASPLALTGLTNGTAYNVRLRAVNAVGPGASSTTVTAKPSRATGACVDEGVVVTKMHGDNKPFYINTPSLMSGSVGWSFAGASVTGVNDLWVNVGSFSSTSLTLNPQQPAAFRVAGRTPTGNLPLAYAYLTARGQAGAQSWTVSLWNGNPALGGSSKICSFTDGVSSVYNNLMASANKPRSVTIVGTPMLGSEFQMVVTGNTGTIGSGPAEDPSVFALSPSMGDNWPAGAYQLVGVRTVFAAGSPAAVDDSPRIRMVGSTARDYTTTYRFLVKSVVPSAVTPSPRMNIASGTQVKVTSPASTTQDIAPIVNPSVSGQLTQNLTDSSLTVNGVTTTTYTLTLTSTHTQQICVDQLQADITSSGEWTLLPEQTTLDGSPWTHESLDGAQVTFGYTCVPANGTRVIVFQVQESQPTNVVIDTRIGGATIDTSAGSSSAASLAINVKSTGFLENYDGVEVGVARNGGAFTYRTGTTDALGNVFFPGVDPDSDYQISLRAPCDHRPQNNPAATAFRLTTGDEARELTLQATVPCAPSLTYDAASDSMRWSEPNDGGSYIRYYTLHQNDPAQPNRWGIFTRHWPAQMRQLDFTIYGAAGCPQVGQAPGPAPFADRPQCLRPMGAPPVGKVYNWRISARNGVPTVGVVKNSGGAGFGTHGYLNAAARGGS